MAFFRQFPKTVYDFQDNGIDTKIVDLFRFVKVNDAYLDDLSIYTYYQIQNGDRPDVVSNSLYGTPEYYWTFFVINEQLKTGLSGWPMSSSEFNEYMDEEYAGIAIEAHPYITTNNETGQTIHWNSLAGGNAASSATFLVGEQVHGSISGASAYVVSKDTQLSQLVLRDVEGTFLNDGNEVLVGEVSSAQVGIGKWYPHRDAPHHFEDSSGNIVYNQWSVDEGLYENPNAALNMVTNYEYEMQLNDERSNLRIVRPEAVYNFAKKFRELINA